MNILFMQFIIIKYGITQKKRLCTQLSIFEHTQYYLLYIFYYIYIIEYWNVYQK